MHVSSLQKVSKIDVKDFLEHVQGLCVQQNMQYYSVRLCNLQAAMEFKTHELLTALALDELARVSASSRLRSKI